MKSKKDKKSESKKTSLENSVLDLRARIEKAGSMLIKKEDMVKHDRFRMLTGILPLDLILTPDIGFTSGCAEIYGPEGVGKTSLVLSLIRSAKQQGRVALLQDVEYGITDELCQIFGVEPNVDFLLAQPDNAEAALNGVELFLRNNRNAVAIIDSIANLLSQGEMDETVQTKSFNPVTLMLSKLAKKAPKICRDNDNLLIYVNQVRDNMNSGHGPKTRVPGPRAVKFLSAWRIEMFRVGLLKEGGKSEEGEDGEVIGQKVGFKTIKNRTTRPFQQAMSNLIYGKGFHQGYDLIELAAAFGMKDLVERSSAWYNFYNGEKIQGINKAANYVLENADVETHLREKLVEICRA